MDFKKIFIKEIREEIMAIDSLPVLAGTVGMLHAASALHTVEDYHYALRCKKAGKEVQTEKRTASNGNNDKGGLGKIELLLRPAALVRGARQNCSRAHLRVVM